MIRKTIRSFSFLLLVAGMSLALTGCDPGIALEPEEWTKQDDTWFTTTQGNLDLKVNSIRDLSGNKSLTFTLEIKNRDTVAVSLLSAVLNASQRAYTATAPDGQPWNPVGPQATGSFLLNCDLGATLHEVLKDSAELVAKLQAGTVTMDLPIRYRQVDL